MGGGKRGEEGERRGFRLAMAYRKSDNLHLENSFEDSGVSGQLVFDMLTLESDVFQRCLSAQPAPTALQRFNRCKGALLLRDLVATADLPAHSALFSQQLLDLTHR